MYAETIATRNTVASHIRALSQVGKPAIDIALSDDEQGAYVRSYSTFDKIEGEVSITAPHDTRFDEIFITFEGEMRFCGLFAILSSFIPYRGVFACPSPNMPCKIISI
jgi:hypothetical protein